MRKKHTNGYCTFLKKNEEEENSMITSNLRKISFVLFACILSLVGSCNSAFAEVANTTPSPALLGNNPPVVTLSLHSYTPGL